MSEAQQEQRSKIELDQLILNIPAKRMFLISKRIDLAPDEIMSDSFAMMLVAAIEVDRKERGPAARDDWDRFLNMGFRDLSIFLGLSDPAEVAPKSDGGVGGDSAGPEPDREDLQLSSGSAEPGDVAAAGDGTGVAPGTGPVLSGDGDPGV